MQLTKTGQVFVFDRDTGAPLFPIEERRRAARRGRRRDAIADAAVLVAAAARSARAVTPEDAWGFTFCDRDACRDKIASLKSEGIFTPPSLQARSNVRATPADRTGAAAHGIPSAIS